MRGLDAWFGAALATARGWLEADFQSPLTQALFAPWILNVGLTPESAYSAKMRKVITVALEAAGVPVIKGGAPAAVNAFEVLITERGDVLRTNLDVERILVHGGEVAGIRLAGGEEVVCGSVLASVTSTQLYGRLLEGEELQEDREEVRCYRHGRGNFQLRYALDRHPEWRAKGLEDVALIHLTDGIDAVSKSANEAQRGMLPETPTICVRQPHRLDPSRCPEGKTVLWLQIPDAPRVIKGDAAGKIACADWDEATREAFADRVEAILARHIENFGEVRLARRTYSPRDLEAMNVNLVGGDPYGGHFGIDQFFIRRPFEHSRNGESAVRGLIQIGASTHPDPGLGGGSGFNAARTLCA